MNPKLFRKILLITVTLVVILLGGYFAVISFRGGGDNTFIDRGSSLFPFGKGSRTEEQRPDGEVIPDETEPDNEVTTEVPLERLRKVTDFPITGFVPIDESRTVVDEAVDENGEVVERIAELAIPKVRYNKKETGHIYESEILDTITQSQLTQTDILAAQEVIFDTAGDHVALRFFNENSAVVESFVATIPTKETSENICTISFQEDIEKGDRGFLAKELQIFLNNQMNLNLTEDGVFGSGSVAALTNFQEQNALETTGVLDEATRTVVNTQCRSILQQIELAKNQPIELQGGFFQENITYFISGPEDHMFAYLFDRGDDTFLVNHDAETGTKSQLFDSPFSEWLPQWVNPSLLTLTTKAAASVEGYLYNLNTKTGAFERVIGDIPGLTTNTSPDGDWVLYSESAGQGIKTYLHNTETNDSSLVGFTTLAEKCTWKDDSSLVYCAVPSFIPPASYPDEWYRGEVSLSDAIFSLEPTSLQTSIVVQPVAEVGENLDIVMPALNSKESYLFFMNKNTGELWSLTL